jgi:non-ribosomal peptide synthetase component F
VAGCDGTVEYDLSLLMAGEAEGLGGSFVYNTDLFDAAIISRMIDHFRIILEHVVADPERRLLDIPLRNVDRERIAEAALQLQLSDQAEQFDCNLS